jgi:hypothetical protein
MQKIMIMTLYAHFFTKDKSLFFSFDTTIVVLIFFSVGVVEEGAIAVQGFFFQSY